MKKKFKPTSFKWEYCGYHDTSKTLPEEVRVIMESSKECQYRRGVEMHSVIIERKEFEDKNGEVAYITPQGVKFIFKKIKEGSPEPKDLDEFIFEKI